MGNKINDSQSLLLPALTCTLAATLAVNGVQALLGLATFAWWHLFTLASLSLLSLASLPERKRSRLAALLRISRQRAAKVLTRLPISNNPGRNAAPALFNNPQTEL